MSQPTEIIKELKNDMKKTWFITGASRGLGRVWTEAALRRGDNVAATARNRADLGALAEAFGDSVLPLELDVTKPEQVGAAVGAAHARFGRFDVVVNNAGYPLVGAVEEVREEEVRALFDTNFYGTLRVIQAVLPILRAQGSGHIVGVSSTLGIVTMPLIGLYCASKWTVEALHESLATEVRPFGIKVTIVEPGAYATGFGGPASGRRSAEMKEYDALRQGVYQRVSTMERGHPDATADAMLRLVDAEAPPLRLFLGSRNLPEARAAYAERLATWEAWRTVSESAQGESIRGSHRADS